MPTDRGEATYSAWIRVARSAQGSAALKDPTDPESYKNGDSHISLPAGYDYAVDLPGSSGARALLKPNTEARLSHLEIESYKAVTIDDALNISRVAINSVALLLPITAKVPIFWDAILVRSDDKAQIRMEYNSPRPSVPLPPLDDIWMQPSLLRFVRVYAEGLRSESPFYRFLSFFKVAQQINAAVRAQLRKLCEKHGVSAPTLNGVLPKDPIALFDSTLVGKKYTVVITSYQELYRNSIAHLDAGDKILPFDLAVEARVRLASMVLAYIVDDLLSQIATMIKELRSRGIPDTDIHFG